MLSTIALETLSIAIYTSYGFIANEARPTNHAQSGARAILLLIVLWIYEHDQYSCQKSEGNHCSS